MDTRRGEGILLGRIAVVLIKRMVERGMVMLEVVEATTVVGVVEIFLRGGG